MKLNIGLKLIINFGLIVCFLIFGITFVDVLINEGRLIEMFLSGGGLIMTLVFKSLID